MLSGAMAGPTLKEPGGAPRTKPGEASEGPEASQRDQVCGRSGRVSGESGQPATPGNREKSRADSGRRSRRDTQTHSRTPPTAQAHGAASPPRQGRSIVCTSNDHDRPPTPDAPTVLPPTLPTGCSLTASDQGTCLLPPPPSPGASPSEPSKPPRNSLTCSLATTRLGEPHGPCWVWTAPQPRLRKPRGATLPGPKSEGSPLGLFLLGAERHEKGKRKAGQERREGQGRRKGPSWTPEQAGPPGPLPWATPTTSRPQGTPLPALTVCLRRGTSRVKQDLLIPSSRKGRPTQPSLGRCPRVPPADTTPASARPPTPQLGGSLTPCRPGGSAPRGVVWFGWRQSGLEPGAWSWRQQDRNPELCGLGESPSLSAPVHTGKWG